MENMHGNRKSEKKNVVKKENSLHKQQTHSYYRFQIKFEIQIQINLFYLFALLFNTVATVGKPLKHLPQFLGGGCFQNVGRGNPQHFDDSVHLVLLKNKQKF